MSSKAAVVVPPTPYPWSPMFKTDREFCASRHAPVQGWPEGPQSHEHQLATVAEGFCPLCPHKRLEPVQPWLEVIAHRDTDEWREGCSEWWARCNCCNTLYRIDNEQVWTTGGNGCVILYTDTGETA